MIPKIIHQMWVGPPMPERLRMLTQRWQDMHPRWEYRLWGDDDLRWLRNRDVYEQAGRFVPSHQIASMQSDIARYEILLRYGGVYLDTDFEPLRPIDDALTSVTELAATQGSPNTDDEVCGAFIACEPGASVMAALVNEIARTWRSWQPHGRHNPAVLVGPMLFTRFWREFNCQVAPQHQWYPYPLNEVTSADVYPTDLTTHNLAAYDLFTEAYAVHHWERLRGYMRRGEI